MKTQFINNKSIEFYIIKHKTQSLLFDILGLNNKKKGFDLKQIHISYIKKNKNIILDKEKKAAKFNSFNFNIKTCKNTRNIFGYPVRGQRTRTNAKTKKKYKLKISL